MRLLAVAILMAAGWVGRLGGDTVVPHQRLVILREQFRVAVGMHGQRHAVGAMPLGYAAQGPERILQAFAQTGKTLGEADRHVLPVRTGQHEVIAKVVEALSLDGHLQGIHVGEIRGPQPARFVHLAEEHFLGRPVQSPPLPDAPLQSPQQFVAVVPGVAFLQQSQQRLSLQAGRPFQLGLHFRPHRRQRIDPRPPGACRLSLAGHLALPVLSRRFAIHACLQRRFLQRPAAL